MKNTTSTFDKKIADIRVTINSKKSEIEAIQSAPLSFEDAEKNINAYLAARSHQFKIDRKVGSFLNSLDELSAANALNNIFHLPGKVDQTFSKTDTVGFLLWLFPDKVKDALLGTIQELKVEHGPNLQDRPQLIQKLQDELRALETKEEALVCEAEASGFNIRRRLDCDPAVILEFEKLPGQKSV